MNIIRNFLGFRDDLHSDSTSNVSAATPVDVAGVALNAEGIIHNENDIDVFSITLNGGGNITVNATTVDFGPNLDIELSLYDENGQLVDSDNPLNDIDASIALTNLPGGVYLVAVDGVGKGNLSTGYSDYGSLGQYFLTGSVQSTNANTAPTGNDDDFSGTEDSPIVVAAPGVLDNDTDPTNDQLSVLLPPITDVANGTLVLETDGSFTYTPNNNFNGTDSFEYLVTDGNGGVGTATVMLTVAAENDVPTATGESYDADQGAPFTTTLGVDDLLLNDSDIDGDLLTVNTAAVSGPANGNISLSSDGTFTYTPNAGFHGIDSFVYAVEDGNGGSAEATATITVTPFGASCNTPAPAGILGDGATDLMYNPITGLMTVRIDSDLPGDEVVAFLIEGPDALDYSPPGAPSWGATAYFGGKVQLIIYNGNINAGMNVDLPLLQYAAGLSAADFTSCVEYGTIGSTGNAARTVYTKVTIVTDTVAPSAQASAADVTIAGGSTHTFDVTFNDNVAIDSADLATGVVLVTGPNGYSEIANVLSVTGGAGSNTATLSIPAAGGTWDMADEGVYTVSVVDYTVTDTSNNFLAGGDIGTFEVALTTTGPTGDFDNDGDLDCDDIDMLSAEIVAGGSNLAFDVDSNGAVNVADLHFWVTDLKGTLLGDANLDFTVDGADFLIWNGNKFQSGTTWCTGDFDGNGITDGADFLIWNASKFQSVDTANATEAVDREASKRNPVAAGPVAKAISTAPAVNQRVQPAGIPTDSLGSLHDRDDAAEEEEVDFLFAELGSSL